MPLPELVTTFIVIIVMEFRSSYGNPYPELNKRDSDTVDIEIFGEAQCIDTTKFLQKQLLPAYKTFGSRLNISYHPFGIPKFAKCGWNGTNIDCSCHHGLRECEKQALQACVISLLPKTDQHLEIVSCIQGGDEFDDSVKKCLADKEPSLRVPSDRFVRCAKSDAGRSLIEHHGSIQRDIAPEVLSVPWIIINGVRDRAAEHNLERALCTRYLKPRPVACAHYEPDLTENSH